MKRIFQSSLVLLTFSFSIVVFNLSCEKDVNAQNTTTASPQVVGLILFSKNGDKSNEIWFAKYDGSNATKISIASFPAGGDMDRSTMKISPDGKKIFFCMYIPSTNMQSIYTCNSDGTGLTKIIEDADEIAQVF
jgi:hypothetical protein